MHACTIKRSLETNPACQHGKQHFPDSMRIKRDPRHTSCMADHDPVSNHARSPSTLPPISYDKEVAGSFQLRYRPFRIRRWAMRLLSHAEPFADLHATDRSLRLPISVSLSLSVSGLRRTMRSIDGDLNAGCFFFKLSGRSAGAAYDT